MKASHSVPPTEMEMRCMELTEYLEEITVNDEVGRKKVEAAGDIVSKFCHLDNFEERYTQPRIGDPPAVIADCEY